MPLTRLQQLRYTALNVISKVEQMAEHERLNGALLSPPRMTRDGFYEAVIADPDGNRVDLEWSDLLKAACRSLYRVV